MYLDLFKTITVILLLILTVTSTFLIGFCLCSLCKLKQLFKRPSVFFILNILLVHLYQSIVVLPLYAMKKHKFDDNYITQIVCDAFRFTYLISYYCSILSALLIAADRFMATHFVLKYKYLVTRRKVLALIFFMWAYTVSLCSIPFVSENKGNITNVNSTKKISSCTYKPAKEWSSFMLIGNCVIPYVILLVLYKGISKIVLEYKQREREREESCLSPNMNVKTKEKRELKENHSVTTLSVILATAYFILWSPSVFYHILRSFCPKSCFTKDFNTSKLEQYVGFVTKYMFFLDSIAAPTVYCLYNNKNLKNFRKRQKEKKRTSSFTEDFLFDSDQFYNARESYL